MRGENRVHQPIVYF